jgi:hypothetical protein
VAIVSPRRITPVLLLESCKRDSAEKGDDSVKNRIEAVTAEGSRLHYRKRCPVTAWFAVFCLLAGATLAATGCSSSSDPGSTNQGPCGAPPGDWKYLFSCDGMLGTVHTCQDYYSTEGAAQAVDPSFRAFCTAESGTILSSTCPETNSLGSCITTSSIGATATSPQGALTRNYLYAQAGSSQSSVRTSCEKEGGVYVPPGSAAPDAGPEGATATCTAGQASSDGGTSGVAFSMALVVNGQVLQCTNYVGNVTQAQLDSVIALGATTTSCPAENAVCACTEVPGSGTFATDPTLVYYKTSMDSSPSTCADAGANCTTMYTPP